LSGVTATMNPPRNPANNEGYFEYIEGPVTQGTLSNAANAGTPYVINGDIQSAQPTPDTTVGDFDDILMFTTRSTGRPFVGMCGGNTIQSDVAEVAWFVRGRTLYRRVLLVAPSADLSGAGETTLYANYDVSARWDSTKSKVVANSLADLTRRECRFAHFAASVGFPYNVATNWYWTLNNSANNPLAIPTLPTLNECSIAAGWDIYTRTHAGTAIDSHLASNSTSYLDFWTNVAGHLPTGNALTGGATGTRVADDVILTNVIGFDVKAWDTTAPVYQSGTAIILPGDPTYLSQTGTPVSYGAYVDLGYGNTTYSAILAKGFSHWGHPKSGLTGSATTARVYDTYSTHYESTGTSSTDTRAGRALNGIDDPEINASGSPTSNDGVVDDIVYDGDPSTGENITAPPYPVPLRGIQVKIRVFEPDSKQVREVTVVQDFLPQ
jgi:hypothetical protein